MNDRIKDHQKLPDNIGVPDTCDLSVVVGFDGWPEDTHRLYSSLASQIAGATWQLVIVENPHDQRASESFAALDNCVHLPLVQKLGWSAARNLGFRSATGRVVVVADTSIEFTGDPFPSLDSALKDPTVGLVGRWGVTSSDGFNFVESDGPDVDGVEGYLMGLRRSDLSKVGLFDPKFRWYRNADIDFSFQVRSSGLRTIVEKSIPVERHTHRQWEAATPEERDTMSQRNFGRFRMHYGNRPELFTSLSG